MIVQDFRQTLRALENYFSVGQALAANVSPAGAFRWQLRVQEYILSHVSRAEAHRFSEQCPLDSVFSEHPCNVAARGALALRHLIDRLARGDVEEDVPVTPAARELDAFSCLHPRVRDVGEKLYRDGHFREAVLSVSIALIEAVKIKSGLPLDGVPLMRRAFSAKNPILKFAATPDEQAGMAEIYAGAVMAIRHPRAHSLGKDDQRHARQLLGILSALFAMLDNASGTRQRP